MTINTMLMHYLLLCLNNYKFVLLDIHFSTDVWDVQQTCPEKHFQYAETRNNNIQIVGLSN